MTRQSVCLIKSKKGPLSHCAIPIHTDKQGGRQDWRFGREREVRGKQEGRGGKKQLLNYAHEREYSVGLGGKETTMQATWGHITTLHNTETRQTCKGGG